VASHSRPRMSYQRMLRAIGAYLDGEDPDRFRLVEVLDGFEVVLERGGQRAELEEIHFSYDTLTEQAESLMRRRKLLGSRHGGGWALASSGRQDFLRALGYELDDSRARFILIDEAEDGMLVTYSYLDPAQGFQWRKHMVVLKRDHIQSVLQSAYGRRHRRRLLRR
jgi:hypothetical protein